MSDVAIKVEGLSKRYKIGKLQRRHDTLRDRIADARVFNLFKRRNGNSHHSSLITHHSDSSDTLWALKDVSFEVKRGEVVGVIGRNGAGKSTLLKILSRITEPTEGYADINGRVGSLLEVGTGFQPELSGRENIYLNGSILGMKRAEIEGKFDEIVAFAEVEKFIDTPVKRYSSGMYLRLAFAVAAHLETEILLVDEVLAVGDAEFQKKCLGKICDVAKQGRTVLFVSHNMGAIKALCSTAIVLRNGRVWLRAAPEEALSRYLSREGGDSGNLANLKERGGDGPVRLTYIEVLDEFGQRLELVQSGQQISLELGFKSGDPYDARLAVIFHIFVATVTGEPLFLCSTQFAPNSPTTLPSNSKIRCSIPRFQLRPGRYLLGIVCKGTADRVVMDEIWGAKTLTVIAGNFFGNHKIPPAYAGPFLVDHSWETDEHQSDPDDIEKIPISI